MEIAIIASNFVKISQWSNRGPENFVYELVSNLNKKTKFNLTVFCSGNSFFSPAIKIESINYLSSIEDRNIGIEFHKLYEMALLSKAFQQQEKFDLYHINIGNAEIVLPFANFVKKPILITLHAPFNQKVKKFFQIDLFKNNKHIYYIAISNNQRKSFLELNYIKTLYHGIDINKFFFNKYGGNNIFWIGRGVPQKGIHLIFEIIKKTKKEAILFIAPSEKFVNWIKNLIEKNKKIAKIYLGKNRSQSQIIKAYQSAKLFLFPIQWEEPFGLVMIESMACGTPIVAFARGSVPEVVKDGETGFIVNPSDDDIRGNWIVKKTGIEGLCEAVERIYSMPEKQYLEMRRACRAHVEKHFTVERMVDDYERVYQEILSKK